MLGLVLALAALAGDPGLVNGGFEDKTPLSGWTLELGAQNGAVQPESKVELDPRQKHGGAASLRFAGDAATRGWRIAKQEVEARPGGRYRLECWTRTAGVKPNGFGLDNCYVGLFLFDAAGELVGRELAQPGRPDSEWTRHELELVAPAGARKASVYVFLSMLGELWVDDLTLSIDGGEAPPRPEGVFREDFAQLKKLPSSWKRKVGATNGTGGAETQVEIDPAQGAQGSPNSLRLSGDAGTLRWIHLVRELPAEPGDLYRWKGLVRAQDVRREGPQLANLHLNLAFVDAQGEVLGSARFGSLEPGTHDWTPLAVEAVAPEGARKVQAGVFLSMSGTAWFDDLELTREQGRPPPYADWVALKGKGLVLRFSPSHPHAGEMKGYLSALEQSKRATCQALDVEFPETITVYLYKDLDEGRLLTGGDLDFADPEHRCVHQRWDSYIGHEMVHVIAHNTLQYGRTGILGEGIAVWLNGQAKNHHATAHELLAQGKLPSVLDMVERFDSSAYPAAGSFCGFLIDRYGLEVFKQLYPLEDPSSKLRELQGKSFPELEADWHGYIGRF